MPRKRIKGISNEHWAVNATKSTTKSYLLCEPSLTFSREQVRRRFNVTSDTQIDAMVWSVGSIDAHFEYEIPEGNEVKQDNRTDADSGNPADGEWIGSVPMNVNENDEIFLK